MGTTTSPGARQVLEEKVGPEDFSAEVDIQSKFWQAVQLHVAAACQTLRNNQRSNWSNGRSDRICTKCHRANRRLDDVALWAPLPERRGKSVGTSVWTCM